MVIEKSHKQKKRREILKSDILKKNSIIKATGTEKGRLSKSQVFLMLWNSGWMNDT